MSVQILSSVPQSQELLKSTHSVWMCLIVKLLSHPTQNGGGCPVRKNLWVRFVWPNFNLVYFTLSSLLNPFPPFTLFMPPSLKQKANFTSYHIFIKYRTINIPEGHQQICSFSLWDQWRYRSHSSRQHISQHPNVEEKVS